MSRVPQPHIARQAVEQPELPAVPPSQFRHEDVSGDGLLALCRRQDAGELRLYMLERGPSSPGSKRQDPIRNTWRAHFRVLA